jgi:hypothetical protein
MKSILFLLFASQWNAILVSGTVRLPFFLMEAMRLCITTSLRPLALAAFLMCGSVLPLTAPVFAADHVPLAASARPQKLEATPAWVAKVAPEWDARDATAPVYLPLLDVQTRVEARQTYRYST